MTNKIPLTCLSLILIISVFLPLVNSAGVASPYWAGNPLKLAPGESTTIQLNLQNMVGDEDKNLEATISGTGATLLDGPIYFVPLGTEVPVNIRVIVPQNANIGETYDISVSFREISTGEGGMLKVATAMTIRLPISVVGEEESAIYGEKPEEASKLWIWIILALVILIVVLRITQKRKSKSSK